MIMDHVETLVKALQDLVTLKDYRDLRGKTPEYLEKKPIVWQQVRDALDGIDQLRTGITELEEKVYPPGHWFCPKCHYYLVSISIHAFSNQFTPNDKAQICLNGCGSMERIAHEQIADMLLKRCDLHAVRILLLEAGLKDLITSCQAIIDNKTDDLYHHKEIIPFLKNRLLVAQSIHDELDIPPTTNYH